MPASVNNKAAPKSAQAVLRAVNSTSSGIAAMRERVRILGRSVSIESHPSEVLRRVELPKRRQNG